MCVARRPGRRIALEIRGWKVSSIGALAVIVAIAVLLIAGYGAPVGIGLVLGMVAGGIAAYVFGLSVLSGRLHRDRGWGSDSLLLRTDDSATAAPDQPEPAWFALADIEEGPIERVIAIGQSVKANGTVVELSALELREAGGLIYAWIRSSAPQLTGPTSGIHVIDDQGTTYVAAWGGGSSHGTAVQTDMRFAPRPPDGASVLVVRIDEIVSWDYGPSRFDRITGPWEFRIPLR